MGSGNVMTLLHDGEHPFWYARVLREFQISVHYIGRHSKDRSLHKMDVLWVRWLGVEPNYHWSFKYARLPKVEFIPDTNEDLTFAFLDPSSVIRACHLIPAFAGGHTVTLMRSGPSLGRLPGKTDDWCAFYVNM
jgi:hypothetical protein